MEEKTDEERWLRSLKTAGEGVCRHLDPRTAGVTRKVIATRDTVKDEHERKRKGEITRQRLRLHTWEPTLGHQTSIHLVGDAVLMG